LERLWSGPKKAASVAEGNPPVNDRKPSASGTNRIDPVILLPVEEEDEDES